jgi:hypothetical protein
MKFIKAFLLLAIIFILAGCASLTFESKDGTKVTYTRFLTTATKIEAQVGDAALKMDNQKINTDQLQALLNLLGMMK